MDLSVKLPRIPHIYRIECKKPDGTIMFYYGSAVDPQRRRSIHAHDLKQGKHANPCMQNHWNKYGPKSFSFHLIEMVMNKSDLLNVENNYIKQWWGHKCCFNINSDSIGGRLGVKMSEESKKNWREKKCKPILQFSMEGELVAKHFSAKDAAKAIGYSSRSSINSSLDGKGNAGGYLWMSEKQYKITPKPMLPKPQNHNRKEVMKFDSKTGKLLATYESITKAAKEMNICPKLISSCLSARKKNNHAGGFMWACKNEINTNTLHLPILPEKHKAVVKLEFETRKLLSTYESIVVAAKDVNITPSQITRCCKGRIKKSAGFAWAYKDQYDDTITS